MKICRDPRNFGKKEKKISIIENHKGTYRKKKKKHKRLKLLESDKTSG